MYSIDIQALLSSVKDVVDEASLNVNSIAEDVAEMSRAKLISLAQAELKTSRDEYLNAISKVEKVQGAFEIRLESSTTKSGFSLPHAVEHGMPAFDMKPGLLKQVKSRHTGKYQKLTGKDYRDVPVSNGPGAAIRRVSRTTSAGKWQHPGIKAKNFFQRVADTVEATISEVLNS